MTAITDESVNAKVRDSDSLSGDIGICMSGGGYRAAAFHLGTLAYLDHLGLAAQITVLSTVSGGTFTGAKYILSLLEPQSFDDFFRDYYCTLKKTNLVAEGLDKLAEKNNMTASGRQDLIVSMAQVYAEKLFSKPGSGEQAGEPYYFDTVLHGEQPIHDVVFNATDFRSGIAFRFQRSKSSEALIGNFYNHINKEDAGKIRLADIVAASSCFPGGFEPLSFPYDFTWQGNEIPEAVQQAFPFDRSGRDSADPKGPVALMDGGVYDNQGLQGLLMADKRSGNQLDLIIISDVDQPSIDLFEMPEPVGYGGPSLGTIAQSALVFMAACCLTLIAIGYNLWLDWGSADWLWQKFFFIYLIPFGLTAVAGGTILYIYRTIRDDILPSIPLVGDRAWESLRRVTIGQVRNMLRLRVTSLLALTSSIFMKRVRQLVYQLVFDRENSNYSGKSVSNLIYSLAPSKTQKQPVKPIQKPSKVLEQVACVAFNQATTLWFDEDYQEPCLVASGQASLCYNLIKHISRSYGDDPEVYSPAVKHKWGQLEKDWTQFNKDPFFMLRSTVNEPWDAVSKHAAAVKCDWGMFETAAPTQSALE